MQDDEQLDIVLRRRDLTKMGGAGLLALLAGCSGDGGGDSGDGTNTTMENGQESPTQLDVGIPFPPQNLDPAYAHDPSSELVVEEILMEGVVWTNNDTQVQPGIVKEVPSPSDGGTTYQYNIREDATFHNGDDVTAEDFKASVEWQENPDNVSPLQGRLSNFESANVIDEKTIEINLSEPFGFFNTWMSAWFRGVVPQGSRGSVEEGSGESGGASTDLSSDMSGAGTGPFQFSEWQSGQYLEVERFDGYFRDNEPRVDTIRFHPITESSTRVAQLESGRIGLTNALSLTNVDQMQNNSDITTLLYPGWLWQCVYMNLQSEIDGENNPLANRHNRRAVMFAIDREEIVNDVFRGRAEKKNTMWFHGQEWSSPNVDERTLYQPEQAREELELAGNSDGIDIRLLTISRDLFSRYASTIQDQLSDVGINTELIPQEESAHFSRVYTSRDWHAAATYGGTNVPNPLDLLFGSWADNNRNHHHWYHGDGGPEGDVPSGPPAPEDVRDEYSNGHEWFSDYHAQTLTETDLQTQKERAWRMQEYLIKHAIGPHIATRFSAHAHQNYVSGYKTGTWHKEYATVSIDQ